MLGGQRRPNGEVPTDVATAERLLRQRFLGFVAGTFLLCIPAGVLLGVRAETLTAPGLLLVALTYALVVGAWWRNRTRYRRAEAVVLMVFMNLLPAGLLFSAETPAHAIALTIYFTLTIVASGFVLGARWALVLVPVDVGLLLYGYFRFVEETRDSPLEEPLRLTTVRGLVVLTLLGVVVWFFSRALRGMVGRLSAANVELRASEEALAGFVREAPDGMVTLDGTGTIRRFNPAAEVITGIAAADALGRNFVELDLLDAQEQERVARLFARYTKQPVNDPVEVRLTRRDGRPCVVEASGRTVTHSDGTTEIHAVLRDVTTRRSLEDQLREGQRLDAVGRLAGGIAHDFNNLLTVVLTNTRSIAERAAPNSETAEEAADIIEAAGRASELTRQLLAFSRQQVLAPRVLELADIVQRMERLLRRLIPESITIVLDTAGPPLRVLADPAQVEQVLVNLAVNARDAMPEGGELRIRVSELDAADPVRAAHAIPSGRWARLTVQDSGHGIPPEVVPRVFDPFFSTKGARGGTGLGLATVHGIVRQSQGHVWVESTPGATAFHVLFPMHEGEPVAEVTEPEAASGATHALSVLLVEDDRAVRDATTRALQRHGHRVLAAGSPAEAIDKARALGGGYDILVTDVVMPGMSGARLAEVLRAERPDLPVVYLSGHAGDALPPEELERPHVAFLAKPFEIDALLGTLGRLIRRSVIPPR